MTGRVSIGRTIAAVFLAALPGAAAAQAGPALVPSTEPWSVRIAESFLLRHPGAVTYDSTSPNERWNYEQGLMLVAMYQMWLHSGDPRYFTFIRQNLDRYVTENGSIRTYSVSEFNIDNIGPGRALLGIFRRTGEERFRLAADTLRRQLREHPRTREGGFWHKKIYPYQMWLDGLFMAQPFYAWYAVLFDESGAWDDLTNQFVWMAAHARDSSTGLLYHGWDESRQQRWADPLTGRSPNFWGRAMGWYAMALVDVLEYIPTRHPGRSRLVDILRDLAKAVVKFRDGDTGLWYQIVDQRGRAGNYLEASASCMFAYCFAKGANNGYLDSTYFGIAREVFRAVTEQFVSVDARGCVDLHGTCRSAGLGGNPYRDGSFAYYISEPKRTNDMKGVGPFLLAAIELERGYLKGTVR